MQENPESTDFEEIQRPDDQKNLSEENVSGDFDIGRSANAELKKKSKQYL